MNRHAGPELPPEDSAALEVACAENGLQLIESLPILAGGSVFVARAVDASGSELLLKRTTGLRGYQEVAVLEAWSHTPFVPRHVRRLDEATHLSEWVRGDLLADVVVGWGTLREIGAALRQLHACEPPARVMPMSQRVSDEWIERDFEGLPQHQREQVKRAAQALRRSRESCLLHGDVVPTNIILSERGPVFIDPIGFAGPGAWDLAQLAIAIPGRDRRKTLQHLLAGYGRQPPQLDAAFRYLALMFLAKNLELDQQVPGTRSVYVRELTSLARTLDGPVL